MTLEQLRVFVAVAERQHVTRAAEALNMAQSAVSASVLMLEGQYGAKLFHRVGRGIALTETGTLFLVEARAVLGRAAAAELVLAELGGLKRGALAIHASQTIAGYWLPRHLVAFRRTHPAIDLRLKVGNTAQVIAAVADGSAELGFIEGASEAAQLANETVARDRLLILVAPDHPWAKQDKVTPDDLAAADWVLRERGSGTRSVFEQALAAMGVPPAKLKVVLELPSNESVRAAVEAAMGATALSASVAAPSLEAALLHALDLTLPEREFQLVRHRERSPSVAAMAFRALVLPSRPS